MSHAELTAHRLYNSMRLDSVSEEVKRHLIILMLSKSSEHDDLEDVAKKISIDDAHLQEMKSHSYYMDEAPEQCTFVSESDEIAYYDTMDEADFLSEEDSAKIMSAWKSL